jgi:CPA1 family monovalent cation:H+ antiporter
MHAVTLALVLLGLTCLASLLNRVIKLPLPLIQIAAGAIAALPPFGLHVDFEPHTFLLLFIPPLLFADGWRIPRRELRALRWPVLGNAVGLVLVTVLLGGFALHWLIPAMPLSVAFAIGAVVSPTDAVAIGAITRRIAVPSRLLHLLESEALLNDASGLVAFRLAVAATLTGQFSWPSAIGNFCLVAIGGLAVGWLLTQAYAWVSRLLSLHQADAPVQAVLSALLPFAAYWLAEQAHVSGILAAVAAGLAANHTGLLERAEYGARMQANSMWRMINYFFNGIVFVLLGSQLPSIAGPSPGGLNLLAVEAPLRVLGQIAGLTLLLIAVRLVWATASMALGRVSGGLDRLPNWRIAAAAAVAGVRGAITLAAVLTLPLALNDGSPFPSRDLAITLATGVILLSLLIASVFLPLLLRSVPSQDGAAPEGALRDELHSARIAAAEAGAAAIASLPEQGGPAGAALLGMYERRLESLRAGRLHQTEPEGTAWLDLHRVALQAERDVVHRLRAAFTINDEAARQLITELDLFEAASTQRPLHFRPARAN